MSFLKTNINPNYQDFSDEVLFGLFKEKNDHKAFETLHHRYKHLVLGVSMKVLKNEENSFDNTHEVFTTLIQNKSKYTINNFKNWIYTFTKNNAIQWLKKDKKNHNLRNDFQKINEESVENAFENTLYNEASENEHNNLTKALADLPHAQRECIDLFYFKRKSYKEIQRQTNFELNEIKSHIQNGKRKLKKLL